MNFTPRTKIGPFIVGILTISVVGLIEWGSHVASTPIIGKQNTLAVEESPQANGHVPIIPAVEVSVPDFHTARSDYYQPVSSWYKNKHWWKRNAPIVGGTGGGALVGGLLGGGKGAIIGNMEELEQHLTALEDKMVAAARVAQTDEQLLAARRDLDARTQPYRDRMSPEQVEMIEKQYLERRLLEDAGLPRLSLFYANEF